ncbi:outer membrane protein assembly factor yaet precursor [hydrocarbon metagenome]|uniref:Outer membrane protein assembly factor yaet n=1 Tax=hydrocarbon metagenome TaxID=938273 RepID=A0A0W8G145_9ZZZZ
MIHRTIKYILLFLFSLTLNAQTVRSIEISGYKNFSSAQYLNWIRINNGSPIFDGIKDSIQTRIAVSLNDNGYFFSAIEIKDKPTEDTSAVNFSVLIDEGQPAGIRSINYYNANSADSSILNNELNYLVGEKFDKYSLETAVARIIDEYENIGFPFANITINSIIVEEDSTGIFTDINISLEKDQKSTIDKIEIIGNEKTNNIVITRAARIFPPEVYSHAKVESIPKRLNRLRFFEPVKVPNFYFNSNNAGVLQITVQEKETNNFDGIIGYVPGDDDEPGYFTGFLNISLRNLFGTGRAAAFRWQKENRFSQELEIKYLEPWILGYPFNVSFGFFQRKQDTTYVQSKFDGAVEFLATDDISASLLFATESVVPTENENNIFTVFNSSIISTGIKLSIDSRDDVYAPREGLYFINSYLYSKKTINGPEQFITPQTKTDINLQRFELDFSFFYELFNRQVIAAGVHAREMRGDFFEISDYYKLGGTSTLRGYRENQFLGNRTFWSNLEYRYLLTPRTFAFLFFDTGYYLRNEDQAKGISELSEFKYGYGLGLNLETGLGVLSVSFALGEGDSFGQGKVHFGIVNEF